MALFKIFNNIQSGNDLPTTAVQGFCYFDASTKLFWIDIKDTPSGVTLDNSDKTSATYRTYRVPLNAYAAEGCTYDSAGNIIASTYIKKSLGTAKGDILYWSAKDTPTKLAVGSSGQVLTVNSSGVPAWSTNINGNAGSASKVNNTLTFDGKSFDGSSAVIGGNMIYYIEGPSTDTTAGTWTGSHSGITSLYNGLTIIYVPKVAGASTTTLNINSLGAKTCYYTNTSKLTTHFATTTPIMLTYYNGSWKRADYDSNSNTVPSAYCETSAGTAAKVSSCTNFTLKANSFIHVLIRYTNTSTSALTLNINSTGAKPIYINGSASSASNYTLPAGTYIAFYDGTNYYFRTDNKLTADITGNAATATKLATGRAIKIGSTSKTFDGSGDLTWTLAEIGA